MPFADWCGVRFSVKRTCCPPLPATVPVDSAYGLSLNDPADVSSTDFLAGFNYAFDCGTGYGEWSAVSSTSCPGVSAAGPHTVKGQIRDKDVGVSEYTATIDCADAGGVQTKFGDDTFVVIEKWASLDALQAHAAAPHMAAYAARTRDLITSRVIHVLSPV